MPAKPVPNTPASQPVAGKAQPAPATSPVRNSPLPKPVAAKKPVEITQAHIAVRAYEIWASGRGGSELDNWFAAERELKTGA